MSIQAGILSLNDCPIDLSVQHRLSTFLDAYGVSTSSAHEDDCVWMTHYSLAVCPEDLHESQPFVSSRGNLMTWDGRLDNRMDLLPQLGRDLRENTTDVAIAMAAYERWGVEGLQMLIGDWSSALWVAKERTLVLSSDFAGVRPLYYTVTPTYVLWSTSLGAVLHAAGSGGFCPDFLVAYMTIGSPLQFSPFTHVRPVKTGTAQSWNVNGTYREHRFWQPLISPIRYRDARDYAAHLRVLFADSVRARLRARQKVWVELSGGYDSSSVACMADLIIRSGCVTTPDFGTVSYVCPHMAVSDETQFIQAVETHIGRRGVHVPLDEVFDLTDQPHSLITPRHPQGCLLAFCRLVRDSHSSVLLSGDGGDLIMGNTTDGGTAAIDDVNDWRLVKAIGSIHAWSRSSQVPIWNVCGRVAREFLPVSLLLESLIRDMIPTDVRLRIRDTRHAAREAFLLTLDGTDRWHDMCSRALSPLALMSTSHRHLITRLHLRLLARFEAPSEFPHVTRSFPFMHRPLVEFALGIPLESMCRPGQPRALMREAFASFLPDSIMARVSKGYAAPLFQRALRRRAAHWLSRIERLHVVQHGLVDVDLLRPKLQSLAHGSNRGISGLTSILRMESWLETRAAVV